MNTKQSLIVFLIGFTLAIYLFAWVTGQSAGSVLSIGAIAMVWSTEIDHFFPNFLKRKNKPEENTRLKSPSVLKRQQHVLMLLPSLLLLLLIDWFRGKIHFHYSIGVLVISIVVIGISMSVSAYADRSKIANTTKPWSRKQ
ncbi:MAG: hypothetical protein AAFR51_15585 [Pseudomonadota bacterium]